MYFSKNYLASAERHSEQVGPGNWSVWSRKRAQKGFWGAFGPGSGLESQELALETDFLVVSTTVLAEIPEIQENPENPVNP